MDINISSRALEKLIDHTASGIGSVAGPMLATWRANRQAEARRILASGEADAMKTIAAAQAKAREIMESPDSNLRMEVDIAQTVTQRIQFQEEKRQRNITSVVQRAAEELVGKEVDGNETDHDWTARFFNYVQDISSEEMQTLWGRVLAGEVERSGSTSVQTLSILRNLDRTTADLFRTLCSARMMPLFGQRGGGAKQAGPDIIPSLDGRATRNSLEEYGLSYASLNRLNEHGLIVPEYNSTWSQRVIDAGPDKSPRWISMALGFQDRIWVLGPIDNREGDFDVEIRGILLTNSGFELARVVDIEAMPEYQQAVADFFEQKGLSMSEIDFGALYTP